MARSCNAPRLDRAVTAVNFHLLDELIGCGWPVFFSSRLAPEVVTVKVVTGERRLMPTLGSRPGDSIGQLVEARDRGRSPTSNLRLRGGLAKMF